MRVLAEYVLIYVQQSCSKSGLIRFWFIFREKNHDKNAIWWKISAECVPLLREARPISSILRPVYSKLVLTLFQLKVVSWRFENSTDKLGVRVSAEYGLIYAKTRQTCSKSGLIGFWFNFGWKNHDKNAIWENIHRMCAFYEPHTTAYIFSLIVQKYRWVCQTPLKMSRKISFRNKKIN